MVEIYLLRVKILIFIILVLLKLTLSFTNGSLEFSKIRESEEALTTHLLEEAMLLTVSSTFGPKYAISSIGNIKE